MSSRHEFSAHAMPVYFFQLCRRAIRDADAIRVRDAGRPHNQRDKETIPDAHHAADVIQDMPPRRCARCASCADMSLLAMSECTRKIRGAGAEPHSAPGAMLIFC